jgi:LacI family transcriptional regulator
MATIYEVSTLAGVSLATVSRVMNNNAKVSEKTRKKVVDAMAELGYRPNSSAQSLASNRTNSVGILVSELHGDFFGQMMAGIEVELRAAGKHVIITTGHCDENKEKDGIEFLFSRNCDAIILHAEAVTDEYLLKLHKGNPPIYIMNRYVEGMSDNCISLNNEIGGYLATQTIIEQGHSQIAYISGPLDKRDSQERLAGHKRALASNNIPFDEDLYYEGDYQETSGSIGLKYFINKNIKFTALICANDEMASGSMTYAREHSFSLPYDLSIIGFDNNNFAKHTYPKLTTIDNPVNEMGKMAAKLILKDIYQQKDLKIRHFFEPKLITRDSVICKI